MEHEVTREINNSKTKYIFSPPKTNKYQICSLAQNFNISIYIEINKKETIITLTIIFTLT